MRSVVAPLFASVLLVGIAFTAALATRGMVRLFEHGPCVEQLVEARLQRQHGLRMIDAGPFARP